MLDGRTNPVRLNRGWYWNYKIFCWTNLFGSPYLIKSKVILHLLCQQSIGTRVITNCCSDVSWKLQNGSAGSSILLFSNHRPVSLVNGFIPSKDRLRTCKKCATSFLVPAFLDNGHHHHTGRQSAPSFAWSTDGTIPFLIDPRSRWQARDRACQLGFETQWCPSITCDLWCQRGCPDGWGFMVRAWLHQGAPLNRIFHSGDDQTLGLHQALNEAVFHYSMLQGPGWRLLICQFGQPDKTRCGVFQNPCASWKLPASGIFDAFF